MAIQLTSEDMGRLVEILSGLSEWALPDSRIEFMNDVLAGSPRQRDILGQLKLHLSQRLSAVNTISILMQFGQDRPGQETLGILINKLKVYIGSGDSADFLTSLFAKYPLQGKTVSTRSLGDEKWQGRDTGATVKEKVIGENTLRPIAMLAVALQRATSVLHITSGGEYGSGFVVGDGLVMTNNHVISSIDEAAQATFMFNYQLDSNGNAEPTTAYDAAVGGLFYTNSEHDLDFTIVELDGLPDTIPALPLARKQVKRDTRVNIIQHPGGRHKQISMQNNFVAYADERTIQYLTATEPGSSGSPVFDDSYHVIGIHHSGSYALLEPESNRRYPRNAGSNMRAVLDDIQKNAPDIYARLNVK